MGGDIDDGIRMPDGGWADDKRRPAKHQPVEEPTTAERHSIYEWGDMVGVHICDPDGFDRSDPEVMTRPRTWQEFSKGLVNSTVTGFVGDEVVGYLDRLHQRIAELEAMLQRTERVDAQRAAENKRLEEEILQCPATHYHAPPWRSAMPARDAVEGSSGFGSLEGKRVGTFSWREGEDG